MTAPTAVPFSPIRSPYLRWLAFTDHTGFALARVTEAQQAARDAFARLTDDEVEQDIRRRAAVLRRERKESRRVSAGTERAMRKMLTEELGMRRIRPATVVTLHRILCRLDDCPHARISQYDETLGDEKTIRGLQHVLADAGYLTQEPMYYGNGKATLQAFKGTGRPRRFVRLISSENYWDGEAEFNDYAQPSRMTDHTPADIDEADVPY